MKDDLPLNGEEQKSTTYKYQILEDTIDGSRNTTETSVINQKMNGSVGKGGYYTRRIRKKPAFHDDFAYNLELKKKNRKGLKKPKDKAPEEDNNPPVHFIEAPKKIRIS